MQEKSKIIALVTASHLSSCPRLLKEAELLDQLGYEIHIVYLNSVPVIEELDREIVQNNTHWNFYPIYWYGKNSNFIQKWISKIKYQFFHQLKIKSDYIQSTSDVLINATMIIKADLYIAHHPSVLVAVAKAAKKYNAKYVYDIEDAFSFMHTNNINHPDKNVFYVESKYIHQASLLSFASPLYKNLYIQTFQLKNNMIDLLNVFKLNDQEVTKYKDRKDLKKISFYWHSQTVGLNRGLQDLIASLSNFDHHQWELHIRGHYTIEVKSELLKSLVNKNAVESVFFHQAISSIELPFRTKEHDIGLALELNTSINRDLCVTNKILEYIASGLGIIATNTQGHTLIMEKMNAKDFIYNNTVDLNYILKVVFDSTFDIKTYKSNSMQLAKSELNLELQSKNWLAEIKDLFN
jgi:hypothetical protein